MAHERYPQLQCSEQSKIGVKRPMARKRNKRNSSLWRRHLTGDQWFGFYQEWLFSLAIQLFEWKGLPETIDPLFVERTLHTRGIIAFYEDSNLRHMAVRGTPMGLNPYGNAIAFQSAMNQYSKQFKLHNYTIPMDEAKEENLGVLVKNQVSSFDGLTVASMRAISSFASLLTENKQTKLVSQNALKIPYILEIDEEEELTFRNILYKIEANEPAIYVNKEQDILDRLKVHQTGASYYLDKLEQDRMDIYNEFLTYFGINNVNIQKKERLITNEANANDELILHNRNKFLKPRKESAKILSELWDMDITVDVNEQVAHLILDSSEKEVDTTDDHE